MYRIVYNTQTDAYRVEKRGVFGWSFVMRPDRNDYRDFDSFESACRWIQRKSEPANSTRRWKIVSDCHV